MGRVAGPIGEALLFPYLRVSFLCLTCRHQVEFGRSPFVCLIASADPPGGPRSDRKGLPVGRGALPSCEQLLNHERGEPPMAVLLPGRIIIWLHGWPDPELG